MSLFTPVFLLFLALAAGVTPLPFSQALFAEEGSRESAVGYWSIAADGKLFPKALTIEIVAAEGGLEARIVAGGEKGERKKGLSTAPRLFWGLRRKNDEYLYGQIQLPEQQERYRCKLWQKGQYLFLRIYKKPTYLTYRLAAVKEIGKREEKESGR